MPPTTRQDVEIHVSGKDDGAESLLDRLALKARALKRDDALSGERALGSFLNRGPGGAIDLGLSAINYGVPAALIDFGARSIGGMAAQANELRRQLLEGKAEADEIMEKFVGTIPVIGPVVEAASQFREFLTGSRLQIDLINDEAAKTTAFFNASSAAAATLRGILKDIAATTASMGAHAAITGEDDPLKRALLMAKEAETSRNRGLADKNAADLEAARKADAAKIQAQDAIIQNLRQQFQQKYGVNDADVNPATSPYASAREYVMIRQAQALRDRYRAERDQHQQQIKNAYAGELGASGADYNADVEKALRDRRQGQLKAVEDQEKAKAEEIAKTEQMLIDRRREEINRLTREDRAESELKEKALRALGRSVEADEEMVRHKYRELKDNAVSARERQALAQSEQIELAQLQARMNGGPSFSNSPATASPYSQRFTRGFSEAMLDRTPNADQATNSAQVATYNLIKQIFDEIKKTTSNPNAVQLKIMGSVSK